MGGLPCPACGTALAALAGEASDPDAGRLICPSCGETYRARRRSPVEPIAPPTARPAAARASLDPPPVGSLTLIWRGAALRAVELAYRAGVFAGGAALLTVGGIVPVVRGWLRDEINTGPAVLEALGGVHVVTETRDPDADLGPVLARTDAPLLFSAVGDVAKRLGVRPPDQVRLTYLPCCGVVAWGRCNALILGLPLLRVLTLAELRAVIAHELAHVARGDATRAARSARFVEGLRQALDRNPGRGLLGVWARLCGRTAARLIGPIAWGQEARADRAAAGIVGGTATASALMKVAVVQPLFREVLEHYDPMTPDAPNLYAFFRTFWYRLPADVHTAMRLRILSRPAGPRDPAHPPLPDRLTLIQGYPDPPASSNGSSIGLNGTADTAPATSYLGDLEGFEQMLHNRLFGLPPVEPSIFHRAGT